MTFEFESLTLGIISSKHLWGDLQGIKTKGGFGRQIEAFARYFGRIILVTPFQERSQPELGYIIQLKELDISPLSYYNGTGIVGKLDFLFKMPIVAYRIIMAQKRCDLIQYRLPGYVGVLGLLARKINRPRPGFNWIGTDWPDRIRQTGNTWQRRLLAAFADRLLAWLIRDMPTFALGEIADKHQASNPYVHRTISTIISRQDIFESKREEISTPPRLLYVGRLAPEKGLDFLLEAMAQCFRDRLVLDLTLIGDGIQREHLEQLASIYGLEQLVHFKGFIPPGDALWHEYHRADIFTLPSLSEGQGKVLIEAMAAGLPIVAARIGGIPTIIKHGCNGLLVEPRSARAIASAIRRLVQEPDTRKRLVEGARTAALHYTIEDQTDVLIQQLSQDFRSLGWL